MPVGVLGLEAVDDVEKEDYEDVVVPAIEAAVAEHGKVRLVYVLGPEFDDYEGEAVWEDLKLGTRHLDGVRADGDRDRCALGRARALKAVQRPVARTGACVPALRARGREAVGRRGRRLTPTGSSSPPACAGRAPRSRRRRWR